MAIYEKHVNIDSTEVATIVSQDVTTALSTSIAGFKNDIASLIASEVKSAVVPLQNALNQAHHERDFLKREIHTLEDELAGLKAQLANTDKSTHEGFATVTKYNKAIWKHVKNGTGAVPKVVKVKKSRKKGHNWMGKPTVVYKQDHNGLYYLAVAGGSRVAVTPHTPFSLSVIKNMCQGKVEHIGWEIHDASPAEIAKAKKLGIYHEW